MNRKNISGSVLGALAAILFAAQAAAAEGPLAVPFDFSHHAIGLDVGVKGTPLTMILDTGVDPSVIEIKRADALGLPVQRGAGGEASGEGDAASAQVFPTVIDGLVVGGRTFPSFDALATDMSTLSASYGKPLEGVLGYSFLQDKIVLIDYPLSTLDILARAGDAVPLIRICRTRYSIVLRSYEGDSIPIIPDFRFGGATAPISLDTGSNGGITLYANALALPGVRAALTETGESAATGARGRTTTKTGTLNAAVGFGPFTLPPGEHVTISKTAGSSDTRLANVGNRLFAAMKLKMLLDYRARQMTLYGDCAR